MVDELAEERDTGRGALGIGDSRSLLHPLRKRPELLIGLLIQRREIAEHPPETGRHLHLRRLRAMASIAHMAGESGTGFAGSLETNGFRPTAPRTFDATLVDGVLNLTRPGACLRILHDFLHRIRDRLRDGCYRRRIWSAGPTTAGLVEPVGPQQHPPILRRSVA